MQQTPALAEQCNECTALTPPAGSSGEKLSGAVENITCALQFIYFRKVTHLDLGSAGGQGSSMILLPAL